MCFSYIALGIFTATPNLGSNLGKESFIRDMCIFTQSLQEALCLGLQIGVDVGLPKNIQKHSFKGTSQEVTRILIPPVW